MLRKMVTMVAASAGCGAHSCYERRAPVAVSKLLKAWRKIHLKHRDITYLGAPLVKLRPRIHRKERYAQPNVAQTCNFFSGLGHRSYSQNGYNRLKRVDVTLSCTSSTARLGSEDLLDGVSEADHMATKSLRDNRSLGKPSIVINDETLVKAIVYEARRGCTNVMGKTKRFSDFLLEQVKAIAESDSSDPNLDARSAVWSMLHDIKLYPQMERRQRVTLLSKVARSLGYDSLQDLIAYDVAAVAASEGLQHQTLVEDLQNINSSSQSKSFVNGQWSVSQQKPDLQESFKPRAILRQVPGVKYGSSDPIRLPDHSVKRTSPSTSVVNEVMSKNESSASKKDRNVDHEALGRNGMNQGTRVEIDGDVEGPGSLKAVPGDQTGSIQLQLADNSFIAHVGSQVSTVARSFHAPAETQTVKKDENSSSATATEAEPLSRLETFVINEKWGIDMSISSVKPLSAALRVRLEENGFSTVRLLLHHFPRMYQNFHPPGQRVEDGQNLSFVGTVVQSRGVPRGFSLGLVEIIVKSEVDDVKSDHPAFAEEVVEGKNHDVRRTGRTVFLHLKRFFKGSRYSNLGFLNAIARKYPENSQVTVCGKVKAMAHRDHFEIREFNIELWDGIYRDDSGFIESSELAGGKPYPVYPARGSLQQSTIEFCVQRLLPSLSAQIDPIPRAFREEFQIQDLHEAYRGIHAPNQSKDAEVARHRLVFDEFFYLQLGMLLLRQELAEKCAPDIDLGSVLHEGFVEMERWSPLTLKVLESLPYNLTNSQIKAAGEVIWDLRRPLPMSRLLQGDVGCGKTIVALLALLEVVDTGCQGALMAPTEFLATQHFERITSWFETLGESERPRIALLTGSTTLSKARAIRRGLEAGEIALAIGTHSLISDSVKFSALKLAVIDEQHRFGVSQRGRLNNKGREAIQAQDQESGGDTDVSESIPYGAPHILAMSATPIPRTLAMAMHGDMSLSQITELPPGRAETTTFAIHGDKKGRQEAYKKVRDELDGGGRVFVVFPVIGESEELPDIRAAETEFKILELEFKDFNVGLVHGRMRPHEKDEAMEKFKSGDTQVLVSTTVIEVGIDIPEASMIVVEHAERYGMAQLHQLRGRVGRSNKTSSCVLLGSRLSSLTRLRILENSRDGFYLAQIDLEQRGPGDLLGKRQSGYIPEFNIARLEKDGSVLEQARHAAEEMLLRYPLLKDLPRIRHELNMRRLPVSLS